MNFGLRTTGLAGALMAVVALGGTNAAAQSKAAAEALFDEGKRLLGAKKYDEACPKFQKSQELDPGIGTLLYLADCYEKAGRTASAWAAFREAASAARAAGQPRRQQIGEERAKLLQAKLSTLTINVAKENAVEGFVLRRDGLAVDEPLWGVPIPVDPGPREIVATAPGRVEWRETVDVGADGAVAALDVPALEVAEADAPDPPPAPAITEPTAPAPAPVHNSAQADVNGDGSGQRTLGLVLAGAGVVGIGVGSFFGLRAASKNSEAEDECPRGDRCDTRRGVELTGEAKDAANISTITFGVGTVALAGGLILFFSAGDSKDDEQAASTRRLSIVPAVGPGAAGVHMGGSF